ncbi:MAG: glycosyltransferase family 4 protein [Cyclobacteriaceae bacterium]|nr:glycosyltransferase family 4 protein [Cyclobacteriaceae bacterium]
MRIGFDAKRLFNNFTGLGNYSRFVVRALLESYPKNIYTLYSPKIKDHPDTKEFRTNPKLLVRTPPRWVKGSGFGSFWRSVNLGNIAFRDGVDLLHGLSNELPVTKPAGLRTVVTVHDLIFIRYPDLYNKIDVKIYNRKLKKACESADKIIAISEQTSRDLQAMMEVDKDRIEVVYQGCDSIFKQRVSADQIAEVKTKYSLPDKFILSIGTIEPRKNALLILKALLKLDRGVSAVLVGKATAYQSELDSFISDNSLSERVQFIHQADFRDLPAIYQSCEVFVYPSRFEGFGIPIVEAIASGVPVIGATGSCLEEAGGPSSKYVDPDDDQALANSVSEIMSDTAMSERMIKESQEYVKQFEAPVIADRLMKIYDSVLSQ